MAQFALGNSNPPTNIETLAIPLPAPRAVHRDYAESESPNARKGIKTCWLVGWMLPMRIVRITKCP